MRIGKATLEIITFPIWINSAGSNSWSDLVSVNQVPQNTPVTNISNTTETKYDDLNFISKSSLISFHADASENRSWKFFAPFGADGNMICK